jgi:hypothetical protein
MESINEDPIKRGQSNVAGKERHGCVSTWLVFIIIVNAIVAAIYFLYRDETLSNLLIDIPPKLITLLGILAVANVLSAILLLLWKKIGFWAFLVTTILGVAINLKIGLSPFQSLFGLISVVVLFGILQVKENGVSAWKNLE